MQSRKNIIRFLTMVFVMNLFFTYSGFSQGFIIPRPVPRRPLVFPVLTEHKVDVTIDNQVANVEVHQVFHNESDRSIEGTYYFPLPKDASISDFKMVVDGKVLSGEILEKQKARKIYEDIVRRQIDPALLEYVDHNLFCAKIFPIPAKGERKIQLKYSSLLMPDGDLIQFTYPLRGEIAREKFGRPRDPLGPFRPMPLDDKNQEVKPYKKNKYREIDQLINIDIKSKIALKNIYSPSHDIDISRKDDHHAIISYEGKRKKSEENFVLYYSFSQNDFGINLLAYKPDKNENGFYMLLVSPKTEFSNREIINKDIILILDTSGSMKGEKIAQAKEALKYCINHLNKNDRFNIITFSTESRLFKEKIVPVSTYRKDAINYIDKIDAKGGTNINQALADALEFEYDDQRSLSIVFITDGLPTVGETNINNIIDNVSQNNRQKIKIFPFGVGYDVNTRLIDKIASVTNSFSDYIEPEENIEQKVSSFYDKISYPVLTSLSLDYASVKVEDVFPKKLPDIYKGSQLTIFGRYDNDQKSVITLTGQVKDKNEKFTYDADFTKPDENNDFLPHLWASRKIGYLVEEIRLHGENKELHEEIVRLSKKYGVMSPYTSFLVQDEEEVADRVFMPKSRAKINSYESALAANGEMKAMSVHAPLEQGKGAVQMSKKARRLKEADTVNDVDNVKRINGRTFYFQNEYWVDSEYENQKLIHIKYGSQAYLNLISEYSKVMKFLSLGEKMIFKFKDRFIKIDDSGEDNISSEKLRGLLK